MKHSVRYHTLDAWLRSRHGEKVQKIPLDAGSSCPNRDGPLGVTGCPFCTAIGSGSGLGCRPLAEQWEYWRTRFAASDRLKHTHLFLGYLQAFTNTYGPARRLARLLDELAALPGLAAALSESGRDAAREAMLSAIPAGRPGAPADVAAAVAFLASEAARYLTGPVLPVGGGLGM